MCLIHDEQLTQETLKRFDENNGVLQAWKVVRIFEDKREMWSPHQPCRLFSGWLMSDRTSRTWNSKDDNCGKGLCCGHRYHQRGNHVCFDEAGAKRMARCLSLVIRERAYYHGREVPYKYRITPVTIYRDDFVAAGQGNQAVVMKAWLHPEDYAKATGTELEPAAVEEKVI